VRRLRRPRIDTDEVSDRWQPRLYLRLILLGLLVAFAIAQVARWASDDIQGRLELTLAQPVSRAAVIVERSAVITLSAGLIA